MERLDTSDSHLEYIFSFFRLFDHYSGITAGNSVLILLLCLFLQSDLTRDLFISKFELDLRHGSILEGGLDGKHVLGLDRLLSLVSKNLSDFDDSEAVCYLYIQVLFLEVQRHPLFFLRYEVDLALEKDVWTQLAWAPVPSP